MLAFGPFIIELLSELFIGFEKFSDGIDAFNQSLPKIVIVDFNLLFEPVLSPWVLSLIFWKQWYVLFGYLVYFGQFLIILDLRLLFLLHCHQLVDLFVTAVQFGSKSLILSFQFFNNHVSLVMLRLYSVFYQTCLGGIVKSWNWFIKTVLWWIYAGYK